MNRLARKWGTDKEHLDKSAMWRHNGAMTIPSKRSSVRDFDRINLRLTAETFALIDAARANRVGNVSRNTWIAEAVAEKLARDTRVNDRHEQGRVANG